VVGVKCFMKQKDYVYYVELSGGLGNQLFQYAFARAMQCRHNGKVIYLTNSFKTDELRKCSIKHFAIDPSWEEDCDYNFMESHPKQYKLFDRLNSVEYHLYKLFRISYDGDKRNLFDRIKQNILSHNGIYTQTGHRYYNIRFYNKPDVKYINGLWHYPGYFNFIGDTLRREIRLSDPSLLPQKYRQLINDNEAVCVHIRRGDYLNYTYYDVCNADYFNEGIRYIKERRPGAVFMIFSDDIDWSKKNITGDNIHYVDEANEDYIDFSLMSMCNHFIISNSTFSWWAAFLGNDPQKIVICPDKWYNDGRNKQQLNLKGWIELQTS